MWKQDWILWLSFINKTSPNNLYVRQRWSPEVTPAHNTVGHNLLVCLSEKQWFSTIDLIFNTFFFF